MWQKLCLELVQKDPVLIEKLSYLLNEEGSLGVEIDHVEAYMDNEENLFGELRDSKNLPDPNIPGQVIGYFDPDSDLESVIDGLREEKGIAKIKLEKLEDQDWHKNWMAYYQVEHLSKFIKIVPQWQDYQAGPDEKVIKLDPGLAFGTGNHQTTRLSSLALELIMEDQDKVLDVGTGSGILSFIAAALGASKVVGLDLDPQAVQAAKDNLTYQEDKHIQKLIKEEAISFKVNDLLEGINMEADIIVANILPHILVRMLDQANQLLKPGKHLILGGILVEKASLIEQALADYPFKQTYKFQAGQWVNYIYQKEEV